MTHLECPSCGVTLSVEPVSGPKKADAERPLAELEALRAFIRALPPGEEYQTSELHNRYREWLSQNPDHPLIGQRNFGLGLQQLGIERRRTATQRSWLL